jgi:hypothetical protein
MKILYTLLVVLIFCGAVGVGGQDADACGAGGKTGQETSEEAPKAEE